MPDGVGVLNPFFNKDVAGFGTLEAFPEGKCFALFYSLKKDVLQPIYLSTGYANYTGDILHFGGTSITAGGEGGRAGPQSSTAKSPERMSRNASSNYMKKALKRLLFSAMIRGG